ncbi:MAG: WD40/YVTN/BNR-like repeat-containing protein [Lysobacterales bacterium]
MNSAKRIPSAMRSTLAVGLVLGLTAAGIGTVSLAANEAGFGVLSAPLDETDPVIQTAEVMPRASHALILDMAEASDRAIAVGERGTILLSESRRDWRQVEGVPTRSTLAAVATVDNQAWAVGHDGVILHSNDGGLSWQRQRAEPFDPDSEDLKSGAPLLDVLFTDSQHGFAVGAYARLLVTEDGGNNWTQRNVLGKTDAEISAAQAEDNSVVNDDTGTLDQDDLALDEETDPHFNAIARTGDGSFFIVAERGSAFRSTDQGHRWQRIQLPYQGSMFGVIGYEGRHVLCFGLRGNVYESFDLGDSWHRLETGTSLSIMGGAGFGEGGAVLVGANGLVLRRTAGSDDFESSTHPHGNVLAAVLALSPAEFAIGGETGLSTFGQ